ncbi:MAG: hypothetical protein AAF462_07305 [Thermodesulfobacteriota bacterium]
MNTSKYLFSIFITALILSACSADNSETNVSANKTYEDPFEYCEVAGTIDRPGVEYTGAKVPESIAEQLRKDVGVAQDYPNDKFAEGTYWRCMDGSVYGCFVGNNIPCEEKADVSKEPNDGMINYCGENPDSDVIPMYASGRSTVYEWKCLNGTPEIVKQVAQTDQAGYIKDIWYKIEP